MYSKIRRITFYTRPGCHLCTAALDLLLELSHEIDGGLTIDEVNILEDPELYKRYRYAIPAIQIDPDAGGPTLTAPINAPELCRALGLDASRTSRPEINVGPNTPHSGGNKMSQPALPPWQRNFVLATQRFVFWLSKHWLALVNLFLALYVGLTFAAPVFMKIGWTGPARAIYTIYKPLCHQLSFRSWFLFGEETVYPRSEYEAHFGLTDADWADVFAHAREFIGDDTIGYKVAFCQRDIASYVALLTAGLAYAYLRKRGLRAMPLWLFILAGVLPMALDGGTQFISLFIPGFPPRESVWQLRVITGALFGFSIAWLAYPYIQEGMDETRETLAARYGWDGHTRSPQSATSREHVIQALEEHGALLPPASQHDDEQTPNEG
jgi:uncharacterized membrane protein